MGRRVLALLWASIEESRLDRLAEFLSILECQFQVERWVEAALVDDGINANSILVNRHRIRQILFFPQGRALTERTYQSYVTQIRENGTRQS